MPDSTQLKHYRHVPASLTVKEVSFFPADFDECRVNNGNCSQQCNNNFGSYNCSCFSGFFLLSDGLTCDGENYNNLVTAN